LISAFEEDTPEVFGRLIDLVFSDLVDHLSFTLKRVEGSDGKAAADWSQLPEIPYRIRCLLESRRCDIKSAQDELVADEYSIRDDVMVVVKSRQDLSQCLREGNLYRPTSEVDRVFVAAYLQHMEANRNQLMEKADVMERKRAIYDNMNIYLRNYFYLHLSATNIHLNIAKLSATFKVANIFKQIVSFASYSRFRKQLVRAVHSKVFDPAADSALTMLVQNLYFVE